MARDKVSKRQDPKDDCNHLSKLLSVITVVITQHEKQTFLKLGHMQSVWVHHFVIRRTLVPALNREWLAGRFVVDRYCERLTPSMQAIPIGPKYPSGLLQ